MSEVSSKKGFTPSMEALPIIAKYREYLDYVERHILNISKAWVEIQEKCEIPFVWDDCRYFALTDAIQKHDLSKLGAEEFTQYRKQFYAVDGELKDKADFESAWSHHKSVNQHHWENWTLKEYYHPYEAELHCTHMVIDWLAMSYEFGDTPRHYYESNKEDIKLPDWAVGYIEEIFDSLEAA